MSIYFEINNILQKFLLPILIVCGFLSNTISFLIMKRIKISATTKYMSFLALIDSGVLLIGGISFWINSVKYNSSTFISIIACKLIPFLFYSFADYSVYIIVLMTIERFYAVWKPLKAKQMNKKRLFRFNILIGCLFCCLVNFHFLITHSLVYQPNFINNNNNNNIDYSYLKSNESVHNFEEENKKNKNFICEYHLWKEFYDYYWIYIDASVYSFVPSFLIITFNILIIILLNKAKNVNSNLSAILHENSYPESDTSSKRLRQLKFNNTLTDFNENDLNKCSSSNRLRRNSLIELQVK